MMTRAAAGDLTPRRITAASPPYSLLPWFSAPVTVDRAAVTGHSYADTIATLGRMAALIQAGATHPTVQQAAIAAAGAGFDQLGRAARARAVHGFLKARVRFLQDEELVAATARLSGLDLAPDAELLIAPWLLLDMSPAVGDCDDFSMAAGAMLRALGVPVELVIVAADPARPDEFSHVYLYAVLEDGSRMAVDASHGPYAGWEAPRVYRREVWPVLSDIRSTGLNGFDPAERRGLYGAGLGFTLPGASTPTVAAGAGWSNILQNVATAGATTAFSILGTRYGQPDAGTYIQTAEGTYYRGGSPAGANLPFPPAVGSGSGLGTWALLGAGALLLVLAMGRR